MMNNKWEIIHIPDKPPVPPNQQPTADVFASVIEPKLANTIVRRLNQIAPLENLRHVKRVRKNCIDGGKNQISIILCVALKGENWLEGTPDGILELINAYQLSPFIAKVAKYAALSKEEWEEQCKLWPTSYHPPTYNIDGITGFSEDDSQSIFNFMKVAIELTSSNPFNQIVNAAVIVDPSVRQWKEKHQYAGKNYAWHPLRHAALVAIENAAARDRHLFPGLGNSGLSIQVDHMQSSSIINPAKRQKIPSEVAEDMTLKACTDGFHSEAVRPYLCTGFDIYLVWEPCAMCAMALVHQRIRRIFYAFPNPNAGALGSVYRLQGEKSLNHHYAVFRILLPEEVFGKKFI
ncbi:PREDICTED: probable inactive tRNA-specific adenosine deaminase-like protein 3 isoform X2 [Nelumbo nucifera]|uniref:Probable inactive tRNA-specific adenosine deaminase-like protein 3 isoform X2 n=1 Tax=Nelumbo nucifera TaxID=4432 RepID=A0A1U7ZF95_NELNU|nr:PREDICTED: probable inactive tRNA-specific adenosine deaminase-like protein 3 isoform X2 [Nelumbo nucifera]